MILFMAVATISVIAALLVVFNKNVVHSALALLVNFAMVAILYFTLNAQFLGIAQILVYAGAIVVLFLFVVMLLGADLGEIVENWLTRRNIFLIFLSLILLTIIGTAVYDYQILGARGDFTQDVAAEFGQTEAVARVLFTEYTLPFQLVAVLLTVGVIGVVWLAQHQQRHKFREIVAVLDSNWADESERRGVDSLRINWLKREEVFDFDTIEIIQATDEDVERFTMQVGNDPDEWRRSGYRQMHCLVQPECELSTNTLRLLHSTFGEVQVRKGWADA